MTAVFPSLTTKVAFTGTLSGSTVPPNTPGATLNWTDVTSRAIPQLDIDRGRQYELDTVQVGLMDVVFDNRDEAFTPMNTASPYWPYLVPYVPIQITATWNATTYNLFTGYVERWPTSWDDQGSRGWATATCVDGLEVLNQFDLKDWTFNEIWQDYPDLFYSMNDSAGSLAAGDDSGNNGPPLQIVQHGAGGTVTFGVTSTVDGAPCVQFAPGSINDGAVLTALAPTWLSSVTSVEFVITPTSNSLRIVDLYADFDHTYSLHWLNRISIGTTSAGYPQLTLGGEGTITGSTSILDGQPHHLALAYNSTTGIYTFLVDGTGIGTIDVSVFPITLGAPFLITVGGDVGYSWAGTLSHFAINADTLSVRHSRPCIAAQQIAAGTPTPSIVGSEPTSDRATRILNWTRSGLPSTSVGYTTGSNLITMGPPLNLSGTTALAAIDDASTTEGSYTYADPNGVITFVFRTARWTRTTPSAILGEQDALYKTAIRQGATPAAWSSSTAYTTGPPAAVVTNNGLTYVAILAGTNHPPATSPTYWQLVEYPYGANIVYDNDPTYIYNIAQVTRQGGIVAVAANQNSINAYFQRPAPQLNLNLAYDADAINRANWIVNVYGGMSIANPTQPAPLSRIETLTLDAASNPALWPFVLGADMGQRITVNRRPLPGTTYTQDFFIEKVNHVAQRNSTTPWLLTLQVTPAALAQVWILEDPVAGAIDSVYRIGY